MRLQSALNVTDLDEIVRSYSAVFDTQPAKVKPGDANREIDEPSSKLVSFENPDVPSRSMNHLGSGTSNRPTMTRQLDEEIVGRR